jgi:Ni/Co efflux regulator RcnB
MKTRWLMAAAAVALLSMTSNPAVAQGRGRGNDQQNRGQAKKAARQFADRDRQAARQWYQQHRARPARGFRDTDRLPPQYETRIAPGYVFDAYARQRSYPAPVEMVRGFTPPPPGYRYLVIGGNVVLVDVEFRVQDVIRFDFILGR